MDNEKIAIIGLGIIAPKAMNKDEFWKNVLEGRNCLGEVPADRWDWKLYYSEDHKAQDKTYSKIGGFIEGFKFDPLKYKIPPQTAAQISRLQQMTIEAARMALEDSGYNKKPFDPKKAAAVIGNAMGAMRKEFTDLRVYKFYNEDMLKKTATFAALDGTKREAILREYEAGIDGDILNITEDTMPGELSNVTAGRIANVFNLNGPNMTLDAACASSLAALDYCVLGLRAGKFDMAVAGGADEMMSPPAYVKFCKIGALSADGSWTFDERANGFVMAEAVSIYILKRLSDAIRDGDKIYALINSVGASSDGKGKGITAPNPKGQRIAIENAFAQVDYSPAEIDMVEAHGTATKVGDAAEVQTLKEVFGPHMDGSKKIGLTSIKSQIGHAKAAAGAVGITKTALALYNKTLPPSINCVKPNPGIDLNLFRIITKAEEWKKQGIRRANVSSFGFGGANFHVTMEEYTGPGHQLYIKAGAAGATAGTGIGKGIVEGITLPQPMPLPAVNENPKIPFSSLQGEAVIFTAPTQKGVIDNAKEFSASTISKWPETYPLVKIAQPLAQKPREAWGVSIVAKSPADLKEKIAFLEKNAKEETWPTPPLNFKLKGVYTFKTAANNNKVGLLFPGQGSQYVDMMRDLAAKYQVVQETFNEADVILEKMIGIRLTEAIWSKPGESKEDLAKREAAIKQTQLTQPSMMTADIAMYRLFREFGIKPDMAIGHSLGEYAAATAAGIFTFENGLRAVTSRAKEMASVKVKDPGKMASVALSYEKVEAQLKKINGYTICANKNCPLQTVIAGEAKAIEQAVQLFKGMGVEAGEIPVSHAFHSEIVAPAMGPYRKFLQSIPIKPADMKILSNVTADFFPQDTQGIYDMLIKQMTSPVEFIKQLERMYAEGVRTFIECGPKRVLSAFATSTLKDKGDITVLASNHPKRGGITEFNDLLANMTALGIPVNWEGKLPAKGCNFFNPYYQNWALQGIGDRVEGRGNSGSSSAYSLQSSASNGQPSALSARVEALGINLNDIAFSGIAAGAPGTLDNLFREHNLDEILEGRNMIEPIPLDWRSKQIEKNVIRVIKSPDGNHRIERIDSVDDAIKLSARKGIFDLEKEFGVPKNIAKAMDNTFRMALGAGVLALKDAGLPLTHYYKKTTTGGWLPEKWSLPEPLASETGVIFASAFPTMESLINEVSSYFMDKYAGKSPDQMWEVYDSIISRLSSKEDKQSLRQWMEQNFSTHHAGEKKDAYAFSQNFLLKVIPIGDSQFAQWVGAKGPAAHISAACASTTQSVHIAESWIRAGKAKRVVIIAADDITNETLNEWTLPGFLASGTATTKENISEAALPFDKRRHGLIVGSAAVALVIEDETLVRARGMKPLARLLLSDSANSAYHVTRLDTDHVASVMEKFVAKVERLYGLDKNQIASKTLFMSHETYTPARGGSASAEVKALKKAFGSAADKVVVSNVKGFTGHTMGASLEDAVAIRALNTGIIPPIANYREPDPELAGINLSKGGKYDLEYALRFAAGFGSHMAMSFVQRTYKVGEARIEDNNLYRRWLSEISNDPEPELEVVFNTLRVKDKKAGARGEGIGVRVPAKTTNTPEKKPQPVLAPAPSAFSPQPSAFTEESVKAEILNMITVKTGYPINMLDPDLDMEADLGIDTVKQAELFAAIREHYSIPRRDNVALKDYPTIRHCVRFVLEETSHKSQVTPIQKPVTGDLQPVTAVAPSASTALTEDSVQTTILNMITEKTGYPKNMLEPDLDMEADLGIDTVKQAELFASIREHYSIPRRDNVALKDYPTIRHCVRFVIDETGNKSQVIEQQSQVTGH
ncbi:MAG TPA: beta-ketoacyl synthase, partial [Elusimicrobia bacterium]|nr:beta-ketoacyl synthase [Elusimicrobiota bacterium]